MHLLVKRGVGYTYYYVVNKSNILSGGVLPYSGSPRINKLCESVNINVVYTSTIDSYIYHKELCDSRGLKFNTTIYGITGSINTVLKNNGIGKPNRVVCIASDGSVLYRDADGDLITLDSIHELD